MATRISHNYQVLLDDGNRIIIPKGNFKLYYSGNDMYKHFLLVN